MVSVPSKGVETLKSRQIPGLDSSEAVEMIIGCSMVTQRPLSINALADRLRLNVRVALGRFRAVIPCPGTRPGGWVSSTILGDIRRRRGPETPTYWFNYTTRLWSTEISGEDDCSDTTNLSVEHLPRTYVDHGQELLFVLGPSLPTTPNLYGK